MRWFYHEPSDSVPPQWRGWVRVLWKVLSAVEVLTVCSIGAPLLFGRWLNENITVRPPVTEWLACFFGIVFWFLPVFAIGCSLVDRKLAWAAFRFFMILVVAIFATVVLTH